MPAPAYRQIAEYVTRQVARGELVRGDRLPPEREMAATHGVAVGTLRRALAELAEGGLIERRHGSGNYVRDPRDIAGVYGFFRLEAVGGGGLPGAWLVSLDRATAPSEAPFATGHRIRRIRTLDEIPVAAEEIWLDAARAPGLDRADIGPSLYAIYLSRFGLRIARIEDRCGVAPLPGWAAPPLDAGSPMGHVTRRSQAQDGAEVEWSQTWFDPERARHVTRAR